MYQSKNKSVGIWLCIRIELMQQLKCENKVNFSDKYPTIVTAQPLPLTQLQPEVVHEEVWVQHNAEIVQTWYSEMKQILFDCSLQNIYENNCLFPLKSTIAVLGPGNILYQHGIHILHHSIKNSWFSQVRELSQQYSLPDPIQIMISPQPKKTFKSCFCKRLCEFTKNDSDIV